MLVEKQITLGRALDIIKDDSINVKVGGRVGFNYCGEINEKAYDELKQYLDRNIVRVEKSISEQNTIIIIFEKQKGDPKGKFATIKECQEYLEKQRKKLEKAKARAEKLANKNK